MVPLSVKIRADASRRGLRVPAHDFRQRAEQQTMEAPRRHTALLRASPAHDENSSPARSDSGSAVTPVPIVWNRLVDLGIDLSIPLHCFILSRSLEQLLVTGSPPARRSSNCLLLTVGEPGTEFQCCQLRCHELVRGALAHGLAERATEREPSRSRRTRMIPFKHHPPARPATALANVRVAMELGRS